MKNSNEDSSLALIDPASPLVESIDKYFDTCVSQLSDFQFQIYTNFNIHVDNVCARLSEEARNDHTKMTIDKLSATSSEVVSKLEKSKELQDELLLQHNNMMNTHSSHFDDLLTSVKDASLDLSSLQQSITVLESFAQTIRVGWSNLKTLSHFLTFINIAFVLTSIGVLRRARGPLFVLALCESALEYLAFWSFESGKIGEEERQQLQMTARHWALLISLFIFLDSFRFFLIEKFSIFQKKRSESQLQAELAKEREEGACRRELEHQSSLTQMDLGEIEHIVTRVMRSNSSSINEVYIDDDVSEGAKDGLGIIKHIKEEEGGEEGGREEEGAEMDRNKEDDNDHGDIDNAFQEEVIELLAQDETGSDVQATSSIINEESVHNSDVRRPKRKSSSDNDDEYHIEDKKRRTSSDNDEEILTISPLPPKKRKKERKSLPTSKKKTKIVDLTEESLLDLTNSELIKILKKKKLDVKGKKADLIERILNAL